MKKELTLSYISSDKERLLNNLSYISEDEMFEKSKMKVLEIIERDSFGVYDNNQD